MYNLETNFIIIFPSGHHDISHSLQDSPSQFQFILLPPSRKLNLVCVNDLHCGGAEKLSSGAACSLSYRDREGRLSPSFVCSMRKWETLVQKYFWGSPVEWRRWSLGEFSLLKMFSIKFYSNFGGTKDHKLLQLTK